jgi:molecular chaperone GrpE
MDDTPSQPDMIEKEQYLRLAADFDNFRKQQVKLAADMTKFAGQAVITEMLALADMVDDALAHAPDAVKEQKEWFAGLEQVSKRFGEDMKRYGVHRIQTAGKPFNPASMEAVQEKPPDRPEQSGMVQSEVRSGYTMHERVIRPARVVVYQ